MSTKSKARFERRHQDEIIVGAILVDLLSVITFGLIDEDDENAETHGH